MLNCRDASRLISESLDRRLTWSEKINIVIHLALCRNCRQYKRQLKQLRQQINHWRKDFFN